MQLRDYTFLGTTQSLCPDCLRLLPAKILNRDGRVYFRKRCPVHGEREDFVCSDVTQYDRMEFSLPGRVPREVGVAPDRGCPYDCGLCTEHEQHTCIGLVELTESSEATVRRDIGTLDRERKLRRMRGGAEAIEAVPIPGLAGRTFAYNKGINVGRKRAIARRAVEMCRDGDSIIINGGTTTFQMVHYLASRRMQVLTNSFPIAEHLLYNSKNTVILPGGAIYREQNIVLSPFENDTIESFWGNKLFVGCYGLNRFGMMEADPLIVQAQTKLLKRSEHVIVMADSSKLRRKSAMIVAGLDRINTIVTDDGAKPEELEDFRNAGIKVIVAKVTEEDEMKKLA